MNKPLTISEYIYRVMMKNDNFHNDPDRWYYIRQHIKRMRSTSSAANAMK